MVLLYIVVCIVVMLLMWYIPSTSFNMLRQLKDKRVRLVYLLLSASTIAIGTCILAITIKQYI